MNTVTKKSILVYHNERSCLNDVKYQVNRIGKKYVTLEPVYGQSQLTGLPTFRQPFNIGVNDLQDGINQGIYSINI